MHLSTDTIGALMDDFSQLLLLLILVGEVALIALVLGAIGWWLYRKKAREAAVFTSEKLHLARRREAYYRFLSQRLNDQARHRRRSGGKESGKAKLARRFLEEELRHTEAARDRDAEIWDLRMASTQALIGLFSDVAGSGFSDADAQSGPPQEPGTEALRRKLREREQAVSQLRQEIQELRPFRDAWMRLHRQASRESKANAELHTALRSAGTDPMTRDRIETALQRYAGEREVLDDYLAATAESYEQAQPEQVRRERRQQHRMNRMHSVVDAASSRVDRASRKAPQLMEDQRQAISELEQKLERAQQAQEVIKHTYSREMQKLKKSNREASDNARMLEKENRRLRLRVRNLIILSRENESTFIPGSQASPGQAGRPDHQTRQAEIDALAAQLKREQAKTEELEQQLKRFHDLEAAIQNTLSGN